MEPDRQRGAFLLLVASSLARLRRLSDRAYHPMNHTIRMLLGCLLPLILIFLLPLFGVGSGVTLFVFLALMFVCHLMMIGGHGHRHSPDHKHPEEERPQGGRR